MMALLRKDLNWLLPCLIVGLSVTVTVLLQESFARLWILPPTSLEAIFHTSWISGAALGLLAAGYDEILGTRDFLRHRPVTSMRLHGAKLLACSLAITICIVLGPALHWIIEKTFGRDVGTGTLRNWLFLGSAMLPAATAAAIALFAGTLPTFPWARLFVAFAAFTVVFTQIDLASATESRPRLTDLMTFVTLHLVMTLVFVSSSFTTLPHLADPDRPWGMRARLIGGGIAAIMIALFYSSLLGLGARELVSTLGRTYPDVGRYQGDFVLYRAVHDRDTRTTVFHRVDRDHAWQGILESAPERLQHGRVSLTNDTWLAPQFGFDAPRYHMERRSVSATRLFTDGSLYVHDRAPETGRPGYFLTGKGPERAAFDADAGLIAAGDVRFVVEPSARRLWGFDGNAACFFEAQLPAGDRPLAIRTVRPGDAETLEFSGEYYQLQQPRLDVVVGERLVYQLSERGFVPAPEWAHEAVKPQRPDATPTPAFRTEVAPDHLGGQVRIFDADGQLVFEHEFRPRTLAEMTCAAAIVGTSLLRPPFLSVVSHLTGTDTTSRDPLLDRLVVGGKHLWIVCMTIGLAAVLALVTYRRLRKRGANFSVGWFWALAILVLGPVAGSVCALIESNRAYAPSPGSPKRGALLIGGPTV